MGEMKKIVCLANSRKHSGRCIAGKEISVNEKVGQWVRPVSARVSREVSEEERNYENGSSPKVLDIIKIEVIGASPQLYQSENYVLDDQVYWIKEGSFNWADLAELADQPVPLWTNGDSSYNGINDRVRVNIAATLKNSLLLIKPDDLTLRTVTEGAFFGNPKRRVRADFSHLGTRYSLIVTDPETERALLAKPNADCKLKDAYLCISLGEPHTDNYCYKLVATVFTEQPL